MPIGISEEHEALRQAARGWVERHCTPAVVRSALDAETESPPPFWADLAAQRWLGLHVDEALGGEGYGLPELAVVLEELGRACAPGPFLPTVLASAVLQAAGKEIAADIVPGLASGETVGTVALGGRLDAEPADDGLRVRGTLRAVPSAHLADVLVARAGDEWCALVTGEFTTTELQSLDPTRRVAEVQVEGAVVPSAGGSTAWRQRGCGIWRRWCSPPRAWAWRNGASTPRPSTPRCGSNSVAPSASSRV